MKKPIVTTLLFLVFTVAYGQDYLSKGNNLIFGSASLTNRNYEEDDPADFDRKERNAGIGIGYGRFIKDNLAIGAYAQYQNNWNRRDQGNSDYFTESNYNFYGGGVFLRKYWPVLPKFGAFVQSNLGYSYGKSLGEEYLADDDEYRSNQFNLEASLGLYYFLFERLSLHVNLGEVGVYSDIRKDLTNDNTDQKVTSVRFDLINTLSFNDLIHLNFYF